MKRKEGRDAAIARADYETARADRLSQALNAMTRRELLAVHANERHPEYKFHVCNLTGAMGGLFLTTFAPDTGQRPSTDVELLDDAAAWAQSYTSIPSAEGLARRSAIEAALAMRQRTMDCAAAAA